MTRRHEVLERVTEAITEADGCEHYDLGYSLYDHVETDALVSLAASDRTDWRLVFGVPDHTVEVRGDGRILVDGAVRGTTESTSEQTG